MFDNDSVLKKRRVMLTKRRIMLEKDRCAPRRFATEKGIFLTFDDGPDERYTPQILDVLGKFRVKATFFVVGKKAKKHSDIVWRIFKEGHDIGNHTYSHPVSPIFRYKSIEKEIRATDKIIKKITGENPYLFRPTWGSWDIHSKRMENISKRLGHYSIRWSISSIDWLGVRKIIRHQILNKGVNSRKIVLFHDGAEKSPFSKRNATVDLLPEILDTAKSRNIFPLKLSSFIPKVK